LAGRQRSEASCNVCKQNIKVPILSIPISKQIGKKKNQVNQDIGRKKWATLDI
jgi:hypothetical protein